ncbi:ribulose-5-phosphate 4-epimerase-like epimerase or aldolase [Acetomicrobium mobile DSM 13181]|uniref:Ribulose-5-phosphate 4-epimerase-like epimerase or aldolase n=1 Tax=Acetomicrobium mobile (strain ATCC BAA-54 / DSM 13181 / JCM 12221 / NGA) TaxID=891968 RepID=I4BU22_ACEMN|nr:L-fuculose-phosphate aldolase [Acetomicrobium mobile]AFM20779.1 ribulose-5-phosphate 4-epimerase-like epimerase or aldolase [Acetomicrobium mobile DSM 13181]
MLLEEKRQVIVEYGKKLITAGLTRGTGGNISVLDEKSKLMAISPSGMDYFETKPEDVVVMDLNGKIVDGFRKPSSEWRMHLIFYQKREDVGAVVHTHSMFATTLATLHWEVPPASYLIAYAGKKVPCAPYATFGTQEIADAAYDAMGEEYNAVLLANHGLIAVGPDMPSAFGIAETIEMVCEIYYRAKCVGEPVILPDEEMELMLEKFKTYGQK